MPKSDFIQSNRCLVKEWYTLLFSLSWLRSLIGSSLELALNALRTQCHYTWRVESVSTPIKNASFIQIFKASNFSLPHISYVPHVHRGIWSLCRCYSNLAQYHKSGWILYWNYCKDRRKDAHVLIYHLAVFHWPFRTSQYLTYMTRLNVQNA